MKKNTKLNQTDRIRFSLLGIAIFCWLGCVKGAAKNPDNNIPLVRGADDVKAIPAHNLANETPALSRAVVRFPTNIPIHERALSTALAQRDTDFIVKELVFLALDYGVKGLHDCQLGYLAQAATYLQSIKINRSGWENNPVISEKVLRDTRSQRNLLFLFSDFAVLVGGILFVGYIRQRKAYLALANQEEVSPKTTPYPVQATVLPEEKPAITQVDAEWLQKVQDVFSEQLSDGSLKIDFAAGKLNLSVRQFNRKLKQVTDRTPNQYLQEIRLEKAREYLIQGRFSTVKEVCFAVGYNDTRYFSKLFEQYFGIKPSEI